jgi:hypothetical protein
VVPPELLPLIWLLDWVFDRLGEWLVAWWLLLGGLLTWPSAERVVALGAIGQLVVLVVAALYARAQVREARELREDQARPFVVLDFEMGHPPLMYLVVANLGRTIARNVRFEVDPPFESSRDASNPVPLAKLKLFTEGIPSLVPGKRIVFLFDLLNHRPKELPNSYRVTLRYEGERGPLPPDVQRLDLDLYRPLVPVQLYTVHHVAQQLGKIEQHISGFFARQRSEEFRKWVEEEQAAERASADRRTAEKGRARLMRRLREVAGRLRHRG